MRCPANRDRAFRHQIDAGAGLVGELMEQLVQLRKSRAEHIPVRFLVGARSGRVARTRLRQLSEALRQTRVEAGQRRDRALFKVLEHVASP